MQKKFKRIIYVSTIFLFIISSLTSQTIDNLVTVKGSYKQKNYIAKTKKTIESSGTFVLSRAHGIIWYTEKPQKSVTVMTEQKVLQVFPNGKEKILGNSGNAVIEKYLHATQTESDVWVYTPKDDTLASVIKKIELKNADNGYIGSAVITYGNGDTTEYMLSVSSFNEALTTDATAYFEK